MAGTCWLKAESTPAAAHSIAAINQRARILKPS
jgi:hypothetical protein